MPNYPNLMKMVEKRKPADDSHIHVQPYCRKMQVLDSWEIVPIQTVEALYIEEVQFPTPGSTSTLYSSDKRRVRARGEDRDVVSDLESFCICEWTSQ